MLSIVVPSYNEEESIEKFLKEINKIKLKKEVIIVDDSTDKTADVARLMLKKLNLNGIVIKREKRMGKGSAVKLGFKKAKGEVVAIIDADLEYPPKKIEEMTKLLDKYDIVTAVRIRKDSFYRKILGTFYRMFVVLLFGLSFDTQAGLKVMKREVSKIDFIANIWAWEPEFFYKIKKAGYSIGTFKVDYSPRSVGESKLTITSPLIMFYELLKTRMNV